MIQAKVICDSVNVFNDRITSMVIRFPRYILAEFNTHRVFSRNSASSRAIPFAKMVKMVEENPFIPIAWQKDHKGMQGTEYFTEKEDIYEKVATHLRALNYAVGYAKEQNKAGVTKQICNRYLEPFMWHNVLVTSTEWENFFYLRCPQYVTAYGNFKSRKEISRFTGANQGAYVEGLNEKKYFDGMEISFLEALFSNLNKGGADIHMMALAEAMYDAYNESTPKKLIPGEWHLVLGDQIDESKLRNDLQGLNKGIFVYNDSTVEQAKLEIATARCARTSYDNFEGNSDDYIKDIHLHDNLSKSGHWSPFEHCAKAMGFSDSDNYVKVEKGLVQNRWCRNYRGFIQYRSLWD